MVSWTPQPLAVRVRQASTLRLSLLSFYKEATFSSLFAHQEVASFARYIHSRHATTVLITPFRIIKSFDKCEMRSSILKWNIKCLASLPSGRNDIGRLRTSLAHLGGSIVTIAENRTNGIEACIAICSTSAENSRVSNALTAFTKENTDLTFIRTSRKIIKHWRFTLWTRSSQINEVLR